MTDKLKPVNCGCGGEAILKHYCYSYGDDDQYYFVWCERCDIQTKTYPTEAEAVEGWNKAMGERKTVKVELNPLAEDIVIGNTTFKVGTRVIAECECGTWLRLGYKYCPSCGAKLDWSGNE